VTALTDLPTPEMEAVVIRAHLAALKSMGEHPAPLTKAQAIQASFTAIMREALAAARSKFRPEALQNQLTVVGVRAIHEKQAGLLPRERLVQRIKSLPKDQATAYSLRYEHEYPDWKIAEIMGITEDQVVALILRALLTTTGVQE